MKLQRIRIAQFRKFAGTIEIDGLAAGLNILHGPNEAGKSTITHAIRTLFFERHGTGGGAFAESIAPHGMGQVSPSIEIDFVLGNDDARVSKTFLTKSRAQLRIGEEQWNGTEAEDELARRLGFSFAGRGASRAQTHGIPGLLWIEQGASPALDESVEHASAPLQEQLRSVLGELSSGAADRVAQAIATELRQFKTPTGRDSGRLAQATKDRNEAQDACDALQEQARQFRELTDRLVTDLAERTRMDQEKPWQGYETKKQDAEARKAALEPLQQSLQASQGKLAELQRHIDGLHQQIRAHKRDLDALAQSRQKLASSLEAHQQAIDSRQAAALERSEARRAHKVAQAQLQAFQQQRQREELVRRLQRTDADIGRIQTLLAKAQQLARSVVERRQQLAASRLDEAALKALAGLERQWRESRIQLDAGATRLSYRLTDGQHIDAGPLGLLRGSNNALINETITLRIAGVGEIDISPSSQDMTRVAAREHRLGSEVAQLRTQLGVADLAAAEQRHDEHISLERDVERLQTQYDALLGGQDESDWREQLADAQGERQACSQQLATLPEVTPTDAATQGASALTAEAVQRQLQDTETQLLQLESTFEKQREQAVAAELEHEQLQARIAAQAERLESDTARQEEDQRQRLLAEALARQQTLQVEIKDVEHQLASQQPQLLDADIERYSLALQQINAQRRQLDDRITTARAQLETLGAEGIDQRLADARERLQRRQRRLDEYRLHADALSLLEERLAARQKALVERLYAPLREQVGHYLGILFPGQAPAVTIDQLRPASLQRQGTTLALAEHSHGTREQLGVIARFAYADLLRQAGKPTLLILDDALVHSDAQRREQMKRIIHDAATRHQILLLTCHPEVWRDAGAQAMIDVAALPQLPAGG